MQRFFAEQTRRDHGTTNESGFTLMELLIVMAIIIIIMTIAIPSYLNVRKAGNETSALGSVHAIHQAEIQYNTAYPAQGFTCNIADLGGPSNGTQGPTSAQLLPLDLASGQKAGYTFALTNCTKVNINGQDQITSYQITAVPQAPGKTGNRGFCSDMSGDVMYDPTGGTNCTLSVK